MTLPEAHRLLFINCDDLCFNKCLPVVNQIYYHFEQRISELENEYKLGLDTDDKLRIQLEERLNCHISKGQMDLVLEYIYDRIGYKELEAPKTCETCKHYDGSYECNNANSIAWETSNRVYPDDYCKDYEPKDTQ